MTELTADGRLLTEVSIVKMDAGDINIGNVDIASMPDVTLGGWVYKGEQSINMNGGAQSATLPSGTNVVHIAAEAGDVRYTINGTASATSGGFVPENMQAYIMKQAALTGLSFWGSSPAVAHLIYYQES
jgi:hypothetical protein